MEKKKEKKFWTKLKTLQVAVVGQSQVGKTALCHQLSSDGTNFAKNYLMTSIMEVHMRSVNIPDTNDVVELYLLDCSGKELYTDILSTEVWKNVAMVVAMYDVCKEDSFGSVAKVSVKISLKSKKRVTTFFQWVEQVAQALKKEDEEGTRLTGVLLGNKTDLTERRVVSPKVL